MARWPVLDDFHVSGNESIVDDEFLFFREFVLLPAMNVTWPLLPAWDTKWQAHDLVLFERDGNVLTRLADRACMCGVSDNVLQSSGDANIKGFFPNATLMLRDVSSHIRVHMPNCHFIHLL